MHKYDEKIRRGRVKGEKRERKSNHKLRGKSVVIPCLKLNKHRHTHSHTHTERQARSLTFCSILLGSKNRESRRRKRTNQYKENIDAEKSLPNA